MERCPKCGNKLSNIDVLCPRCGALVEVIQVKNSFIPPATTENPLPQPKAERPNLIVYNEDLPGEGLFPETAEEEKTASMDQAPISNDFSDLSAFSLPDLSDIQLPELEADVDSSSELSDNASEPQADTRMARRARERQWLELEEINATASSPEAQLLKEADDLTSASRTSRSQSGYDASRKTVLQPIPGSSDNTTDESFFDHDSLYEEEPRRYRSRQRQSVSAPKNFGLKKLPVAASILLWVMLAAALFLGFFFLNRYVQTTYGGYPGFIRGITNGKIDLGTGDSHAGAIDVTIAEAKTETGAPAHTFNVSASGATAVRVLQTGDTFNMKDGAAVFTIPDESIALALGAVTYDNTVKAENLNFDFTFASSNEKYTVDPFDLFLIRSEYVREAPLQTYSSVSSDIVALSVTVAPESTIFINNVNYTDKVADDGQFSTDLKLDSAGDNIFVVDVIQPGRQAIKDSFTVSRQAAQTKLEPESEYQRVYSDSFECRGKTEAGATLSAELNGKTFAGLVSENGVFSAACTVSKFGLYNVKLTATSPDKANSELEITVEYLPEFKTISTKAQKETIPNAVKNADQLADTDIKIVGRPKELAAEGLTQKFLLVSGSSQLKCYFYGDAPKLSADNDYTFYGTMDETGQFYVMYVE